MPSSTAVALTVAALAALVILLAARARPKAKTKSRRVGEVYPKGSFEELLLAIYPEAFRFSALKNGAYQSDFPPGSLLEGDSGGSQVRPADDFVFQGKVSYSEGDQSAIINYSMRLTNLRTYNVWPCLPNPDTGNGEIGKRVSLLSQNGSKKRYLVRYMVRYERLSSMSVYADLVLWVGSPDVRKAVSQYKTSIAYLAPGSGMVSFIADVECGGAKGPYITKLEFLDWQIVDWPTWSLDQVLPTQKTPIPLDLTRFGMGPTLDPTKVVIPEAGKGLFDHYFPACKQLLSFWTSQPIDSRFWPYLTIAAPCP